jgi:hypothetical protein
MIKKLKVNNSTPFSMPTVSMSSEEEYEIVYNGTTFEMVPVGSGGLQGHDLSGYLYDEEDGSSYWDDWVKETKESKCNHEWEATQLFFSTVYDCVKCGAKKEDNK